MHPQPPQRGCQAIVVGGDQPAVAEGAEVLARKEREAAERAEAADRTPLVQGPDCLRRVLDDWHARLRRRGQNRIEVRRLAVQMDGDDRLRPRRDGRRHPRRVDVVRDGVDVDEHGRRAEPRHAAGGREERIRAGDDLVARADAQGHHRDEQGVGARRHADGVFDVQQRGQLALEALDLGAHDEALAVADTRHDVEDLLADRPVLRLQVQQRHVHDRLFRSHHRLQAPVRAASAGTRDGMVPPAGRHPQPRRAAVTAGVP